MPLFVDLILPLRCGVPFVLQGVVTDTLGPVFAKEAIEIARRKRFYVNRCLIGLVLFSIVLAFAVDYGNLSGEDAQARRRLARIGNELSTAVSVIQFAAVFAFVPLFTCAVIAGEREAHTLELLFTTTLNDREIVLSKLASRLVTMATLVLSGLPILSIAFFMGGVDPETVWRSTVVTLLATLLVGAHAIYFSTTTRSPLGALVRTYWWLTVGLLFVPLIVRFGIYQISVNMPFRADEVMTGLAIFNPALMFGLVHEGTTFGQLNTLVGGRLLSCGIAGTTLWSGLLIYRAIRRLRFDPVPMRMPARLRGLITRFKSLVPRPSWRWQRRDSADGNPLWVRACRAFVYDREGYIRRVQLGGWLLAATFFIFLACVEPRAVGDEEVSIVFAAFAWGGIALLAVVLAGASLAGDRKRGWLELVLVTPLSGQQIIDGTLWAIWQHLRRIVWLPVVLAALFCFTGASLPHGAIASVITGTLFVALTVLYGVAFSLCARSVTVGLAATFAFPIAVNVGTGIMIGALEEDHAIILWPLSIGLFWMGWFWIRRAKHCGAVFCFLLGTHLLLASLATFWTTDFRRDQFPAAAMHAGFLTAVMLDDNYSREFRPWSAFLILTCYWTALVINFVWARRWLIRNFDRLAGRFDPRQGAATSGPRQDWATPSAQSSMRKVDEITTQSPT